MNNMRSPYHRIFILLLILITLSVGMHFLHDSQPGHSDSFGNNSGSCNGAIHYGILISAILGMLPTALIIKIDFINWQNLHSSRLFIIVPPPII